MKIPTQKDIKEKLLEVMKRDGLSQADVAKISGVAQKTISNIFNEGSVKSMRADTLQKIISSFNLEFEIKGAKEEAGTYSTERMKKSEIYWIEKEWPNMPLDARKAVFYIVKSHSKKRTDRRIKLKLVKIDRRRD